MKRLTLQAGKHYDLRIEFCEHWYKAKMQLCGAPVDPAQFQPAVAAAKKADVAIVVLGTDGSVEAEGVDRSDLDLPGVQEELLKAVYQANPKTVLVLQNGSALSINWAKENIPAILTAWYPGEEGGHAIADVLFGDYNPAGRLPLTFYKSVQQLPPMDDYDIRRGRTYMAEIRRAGSYQTEKDEPLYPFGYGMSYTPFKYSNLQISPKTSDSKGQVQVSVTIKNIGSRSGEEVVQLYVRDVHASVARPIMELKGFKRIALEPQESKTVTMSIPATDLAFWDVHKKMFVVEPGRFDVMVGASSTDIRLKGGFEIVGDFIK
jgi:beta-glucosidase